MEIIQNYNKPIIEHIEKLNQLLSIEKYNKQLYIDLIKTEKLRLMKLPTIFGYIGLLFCIIGIHKWHYYFSYSIDSNSRLCTKCKTDQRSGYQGYIKN